MNAGMTFEIAVRDILPGAELTDDYRMLNKSLPYECACGSPRCHRRICADDFLHHAHRWDEIVRAAFPSIADVEQPLWKMVKEKEEIAQALAEPHRIPSCRANYFFWGKRLNSQQQYMEAVTTVLHVGPNYRNQEPFAGAISRASEARNGIGHHLFRYSALARGHRGAFGAVALLFLVTCAFESVLLPLMFRTLIDDVLAPRNEALLGPLLVGLIVAGMVYAVVAVARDILHARVSQAILVSVRERLYTHLQRQSVGFHARTQAATLLAHFTTDLTVLEHSLVGGVMWGSTAVFGLVLARACFSR